MTDPKEVAARALALTKQIEAIFYHDQNPGGAVQVRSKARALLTATALETLSAELERVKGERDEAREEVARYWTSADMTPWVELAESKGLGHFGKKLKGMFNRAINAEARAERAEASLGVAETEIICLNKMLGDARKALEPFAHAVFNDNGDVTLDMSDIGTKDYLRARSALASIQAKGE